MASGEVFIEGLLDGSDEGDSSMEFWLAQQVTLPVNIETGDRKQQT